MGNWKDILRSVAPSIAGALGGPLAASAAQVASNVLLGRPDGTEQELSQALLTASPDKLYELKQADNQHAEIMERIAAEDRADARKLFAVDKSPQKILSAIYTVGYFGIFIGLLQGFLIIPEGQEALVLTLMGALTSAQLQIMNFWFGSSSGSKDKT